MIKEYQLYVRAEADGEAPRLSGPVTVDLKYVSTAAASADHPDFIVITVVPLPQSLLLKEDYTRFLRDWHSVKR